MMNRSFCITEHHFFRNYLTVILIPIMLITTGCNFLNDPPDELAILSVSPNPFSDTVKVVYSVVSESSF
jgi:hypothetical protein